MADCDETLRQLYAYLDEILDDDMRQDIASHVGDCPDCKERVDFEYTLMVNIRRRAKEEALPDELRRRLLECFDLRDLDENVSDGTRQEHA